MFCLLDRQLFWSYVKSYLVCLVSLLGLFVVVDLFTNLDEFARGGKSFVLLLQHIGTYYGWKMTQIFDRLCEAIVLLAAMFTVAWMQRSNELLPLLSAGVSTRRVVRPVLAASFVMLTLAVLNQELVLPRVDGFLVESPGNFDNAKKVPVRGAFETNGIFISGQFGYHQNQLVENFTCVFPPRLVRDSIITLQAREATYVPKSEQRRSGGWLLTAATPLTLENWTRTDLIEPLGAGRYFLYTNDVGFSTLTRGKNWMLFTSTPQLFQEINKPGNSQQANLAVSFHTRLTRPLLGMILVLLGLAVILRDQNSNIFVSAGLCLALCGVFFGVCFFSQFLGNYEKVSPAFAAWLPVIVFGPLSFVMFDAVHT